MTTNVTLVTSASEARGQLVYKIVFDSDAQFEDWHNDRKLVTDRHFRHAGVHTLASNTCIVVQYQDKRATESWVYDLTWADLLALLEKADTEYGIPVGSAVAGRPPKRVLVATTSKERREGVRRVSY